MDLKSSYVHLMRDLRQIAQRVGVFEALEQRCERRLGLWLRLLLATYDICLQQALSRLNTPRLIVFDNAERWRYRAALQQLTLPTIPTWGLTPCLPYPESTLLIFSDHAILQQVVGHPA
ncbi:MAG: hypothetical protein KDJ22_00570 [Candidatus Competibacteraceae bacterium]|nr:hypothetical protein [Candidatus Competibacteraceae bacterium]MCP5124360.1 hypothetical protein [Gammaproteobacteria bacterium]HRX70014.1 hypothetical protein [Candidatus Competibacteraceae bacterium]